MKIYDISQEVFGCEVYPGDPAPERKILSSIDEGGLCNLTAFSMCAHNGTHVDAPNHFINCGKTVDEISLESVIGMCFVVEQSGAITRGDAFEIINRARSACPEASKRILIKGTAEVTNDAAAVFEASKILLLGNESQTVGPEEAPMETHKILLGSGVILLEGIRLASVPEGVYLLNAAPINLGGADGAPCRAVLLEL